MKNTFPKRPINSKHDVLIGWEGELQQMHIAILQQGKCSADFAFQLPKMGHASDLVISANSGISPGSFGRAFGIGGGHSKRKRKRWKFAC